MADPEVEYIETVESETIIEEVVVTDYIETSEVEVLTDTETEIVEEMEQGPPGPPGVQGVQGLPGLAGEANIGGLEIYVANPIPGDVLALDPTLTWTNQRPDLITDGGNF